MFDQNYYNYLLQSSPAAAAAYLAQFQQQAAPQQPQVQQFAQQPALQGTPAAPVAELARGTLEDFDDQRVGGGGPGVTKFYQGRAQGSWVHLRITRDITNADVRQQTDFVTKQPKTFRDGKPKFDLWVPVTIVATSDPAGQVAVFPEGTGMMYLKPDSGDGLKSTVQRALAGIGNPDGLRTGKIGGIELVISSAGEKPNPGRAATKLYTVQAFPTAAGSSATAPAAAPAAAAPVVPTPVPAAPVLPTPPAGPVTQQAPAAPAVPTVSAPAAAPAPAPTEDAEKAALLARLTGVAAQ